MKAFRPTSCVVNFIKQPKEPGAILGIALYTVFIMYLVAAVYSSNMNWGIYVGDRFVAVTESRAEACKAVQFVRDSVTGGDGGSVLVERMRVEKISQNSPLLSGRELVAVLDEAVTSRVLGTEVRVNGEKALVMKDLKEARIMLDLLLATYSDGPQSSTRLADDVQLADGLVDKKDIVDIDTALHLVRTSRNAVVQYHVVEGDTLSEIAKKTGQTVEKILAINEGMNANKLSLGQKISLGVPEQLINVETIYDRPVEEEISAPVQEKQDTSLYLGETKVVSNGKNGKKEVTYRLTKRNGVVVASTVMSEKVLEQPNPKVIARGSKLLLASRSGGSGRLGWPTVGSVLSPYGTRWGRMHEGVDISGAYGNPVGAAESGTVTRASWYGGYGRCVDVSHGNGVVTRYAHLSSISVKVGQQVQRGQLVGRIGSTGHSTGPHLHFEVLVNGQHKNPMLFL